MSHEIPDPVAFVSDALAAQGALVESTDDGCLAVLRPEMARDLRVPETCTLATDLNRAAPDAVSCAIGSPLLERLAESARANVPFAALASAAAAPRVGQARAQAERFAIRNAVFEVTEAGPVDTPYLLAWFAWRADADDRYDGKIALALHADDGSEPDGALSTLVDPARSANGLTLGLFPPSPPSRSVMELLVRRATTAARAAIVPACAAVARRHERDYRRIDEYFAALARDAKAPKRRIETAALAQKMAHLSRDRDAKLRDLAERYSMRVSLEPVAFVALTIPSVRVQLRVRRRKREGGIVLRLPATAASLDRLTCAACGGTTAHPAVCDDALHILCENCVPNAQGRPNCGAC
jgi:hypothetical protein